MYGLDWLGLLYAGREKENPVKTTVNSFIALILALIFATAGCAPPSEEKAPAEEEGSQQAAQIQAPEPSTEAAEPAEPAPIREGSEPKDEAAPFGGAEMAKTESGEAVDRSISDATPYDDKGMLEGLTPPGWSQAGPIEHYNVASLYTKIDGRSELYMSYDVLGMAWVSFVKDGDPNTFLDLFVYDMRSPTNAFGIFSVEREPGQPTVDLGRMAYRTGANYYFWQGKYYGYVNASQDTEETRTVGKGILIALMQRIPDSGGPVEGLDWLPEKGLIQDTIQYFKVDAMSLDFLTDTYIAAYKFDDTEARVFVSLRPSDEDAEQIVKDFKEYGDNYAESTEDKTVDGVDVVVSDWGGGFYDAAFHIGPMVAGLSNVEGQETLNTALPALIKELRDDG